MVHHWLEFLNLKAFRLCLVLLPIFGKWILQLPNASLGCFVPVMLQWPSLGQSAPHCCATCITPQKSLVAMWGMFWYLSSRILFFLWTDSTAWLLRVHCSREYDLDFLGCTGSMVRHWSWDCRFHCSCSSHWRGNVLPTLETQHCCVDFMPLIPQFVASQSIILPVPVQSLHFVVQ